MQPGSTLTEQRQAPKHHHLGLGITTGQNAGPAQLVVQKALAEETAEEALGQAVLQMQMH